MGRTVVEVVKVIAPIALNELAKSAANLLDNPSSSAFYTRQTVGDQSSGNIILQDTTQYVKNNFQGNYHYFYKGMDSSPKHIVEDGDVLAAALDILVWDPSNNSESDITKYLTETFKDSISDDDAITVADDLSDIFKDRFTAQALSWTGLVKTFNLNDHVRIDMQMVTAAGHNSDGKPIGIATFCFVAYPVKK